MTAKIFRNSFFVGLLVLLAAGILFLSVMYANDETLAFDELETEMAVLAPAVERLGLPYLQELDAAGRVTWIAADGSVLYDNSARKDNMENHLAREEIAAALETGEGRATRDSQTGGARTHYIARRLADGSVLRTACTQTSLARLILNLLLPVLWIVLLILVLCAAVSFRLARQITSPINQIEIDFLEKTRAFASKFYFAVNKADIVDEEDLEAYLTYCRRLIAKLMEVDEIQLFAVSAKKQTGLTELEEAVERDCRQKAADIIQASVRLKLRDIVQSALNQITLYRTALSMTGDEFEEKFGQMHQTFTAVQEEAAAFGQEFAGNGAMLQAQLNQFKNQLSDKVQQLFGIEYHYDLPEVELDETAVGSDLDQAVFLQQTERLCEDLSKTLNTIFMYREENAYTVVRRINDLNRLVRSLARMRSELAAEE